MVIRLAASAPAAPLLCRSTRASCRNSRLRAWSGWRGPPSWPLGEGERGLWVVLAALLEEGEIGRRAARQSERENECGRRLRVERVCSATHLHLQGRRTAILQGQCRTPGGLSVAVDHLLRVRLRLEDTWVGVCHAVIHRACPQAHVVDLGHQIPPFDIRKGAATAAAASTSCPRRFTSSWSIPESAVGGGTYVSSPRAGTRLVGPDNGVLVPAALARRRNDRSVLARPAKIDFRGAARHVSRARRARPGGRCAGLRCRAAVLGDAVALESLAPAPFGPCAAKGSTCSARCSRPTGSARCRFNIPAEDLGPGTAGRHA